MVKKIGKRVRKKRKVQKSRFTSQFPVINVDDVYVRSEEKEEDDDDVDSEREMSLDDAHRLSFLANSRFVIVES